MIFSFLSSSIHLFISFLHFYKVSFPCSLDPAFPVLRFPCLHSQKLQRASKKAGKACVLYCLVSALLLRTAYSLLLRLFTFPPTEKIHTEKEYLLLFSYSCQEILIHYQPCSSACLLRNYLFQSLTCNFNRLLLLEART